MKDLIDFKKVWDWCVARWRTSFGCVVLALITFWLGMALQEKTDHGGLPVHGFIP